MYEFNAATSETKKIAKLTTVNNRSFTGYQILNDGNGIIRVLTSEGAFSIDREGKVSKGLSISEVENQFKSGGLIYSLTEDYIGNLWVGTSSGLIKFEKQPVEFTNYPEDGDVETTFGADRITSILHLEDSRYLVASTGGIYNFDKKSGQFSKYRNNLTAFEGVLVYTLFKDQKKNLWAGTKKGLLKLQLSGVNLTATPVRFKESPDNDEWINRITSITEDSEGYLWIGTIRGLIKYSPISGGYKIFYYHADFGNEGDTYILSLYFNNGILWAGTNSEGLLRINTSDMSHIRYSTHSIVEPKLTGDKIMAIHEDKKGNLWIATMGGGVNVLDKDLNKIRTISISDGLANNTVYGILEDKSGNIWVSTNKGISRINAETLKPANFSRSDGLLSGGYHQYSYLKGLDGSFYFGGSNGITVFNPNKITPNTKKPKVALTDFRIFKNPALDRFIEREVELSYDENFFTFEMTATNFEDPSSNEYHWKLEGLADEWVNAGNRRTVDISNIPPGTYLFKVKVANREGIWSDETLLAKIVVVPPFWRTVWFIVLSGIVLTGIFISITIAILRRKLNREIAEPEREKMIFMERAKTRDRIARDLHDDLASTVSGAGLYIQSATNVMGQNDEVARKMIEKSASLLTEAEQAMRDIVWSVSPQYDNVENLIIRVRILTRELCEAAGIRFEFDKSGETTSMLKDEIRRNLYLSVKEVLMNAVKHSGASQISVVVEVGERNISIKIVDDGTGFRMESQTEKLGGNGLANIRKRCAEIGASAEIVSAEGTGTTVIIKAGIEK
ncbi:MAG: hypothetical protein IPJ75_11450 [Ignavibacteriales bacterium]|nr:hypothetical protein [Ignavibacteriales bacterium]